MSLPPSRFFFGRSVATLASIPYWEILFYYFLFSAIWCFKLKRQSPPPHHHFFFTREYTFDGF